MQIMRSIIILFILVCSCLGNDVAPDKESYLDNTELINKHLQENYNIILNKKIKLVLTGNVVKENDKSLDHKTYTNLKIEF